MKSHEDKIVSYSLFDTCSNSTMIVEPNILREILLNTSLKVVNANIQNNNIVIEEKWEKDLATFKGTGCKQKFSGVRFVLIAHNEDNTYRVVDFNGDISNIWEEDLQDLIEYNNITNTQNEYQIVKDKEFEKSIAVKYNKFIAKTRLLGMGDNTFDYEIENQDVRLVNYTGENKNIILPSFITAIMTGAFSNVSIKTIQMK